MPDLPDINNRVGITGTVPIEVLYAAGRRPLDLNNFFITGRPLEDIHVAESSGFPINCCSWIKGLYGAARRLGLCDVVGVAQGDCSNTHALLEIWASEGLSVYDFQYPVPPSRPQLEAAIADFARRFGATLDQAEQVHRSFDPIRQLLGRLDELTWQTGQVTGLENHLWLIGASDFGGDPDDYQTRLTAFLDQARARTENQPALRLGYLGIPPICDGLYEFLAGFGAAVVFNEFQRQFAMLPPARDLVEQYLAYTYPYGVEARIADITEAVRTRRLDGLIHYVQSFCFRHIQDRLIREAVDVPVLTLEYDRPGRLDGRSRTRLEAFLELLTAAPRNRA